MKKGTGHKRRSVEKRNRLQYKYDTSKIQVQYKVERKSAESAESAESAKQNFKSARVSECHDKKNKMDKWT